MKRRALAALGLCLALCSALSSARAAPLQPVAALRPERGFIDDAYVLSTDGATLYFVATDGATWAELRRADLSKLTALAPASELLGAAPLATEALHLLPGDRLLVIERLDERRSASLRAIDERRSASLRAIEPAGTVQASVFDLKRADKKGAAAAKERLGPAHAIGVTQVGGAPAVVAFTRPEPTGRLPEYRVQAVAAASWRSLGNRTYRALSEDGRVQTPAGPALFLFPFGGFLDLAVKQDGLFDKKADIRRPDRLAFFDALSGKERATAPIGDPGPLLELAALRQAHLGESVFLRVEPAEGAVQLFPAPRADDPPAGRRVPVALPRKFGLYDPATLRYQALPSPSAPVRLLASLTVDPVNPDAVARKKADPDQIDLISVDPHTGAATPLVTLPGAGRPSSWVANSSGTRLCLLRKHKGFGRGGTAVEVYDIPASAPAPAAAQSAP